MSVFHTEEHCEAISGSHGYDHECGNKHKVDREGYKLCNLHAKRYDNGHEVKIAGEPSRYSIGYSVTTKATIQKTFEDEDQKRYVQRGVTCHEVDPKDDKTEWLDAEPDKGMILCNVITEVQARRERAKREFEKELKWLERHETATKEELERWMNDTPEPDPDKDDCPECYMSYQLNRERERGMCDDCVDRMESGTVMCEDCGEECTIAIDHDRGICTDCYEEEN